MTREDFLKEVANITSGHRDNDNRAEDCFETISNLWWAYLQVACYDSDGGLEGIKPDDVCMLMILLKVARYAHGHSQQDSLLDIAGYAACCAEKLQ